MILYLYSISFFLFFFFFSSRRRHTRWPRDWSSDVCSSDLFSTPQAYDKVLIEHEKEYVKEFMNEYMEKASDAGVKDYEKLIEYGSPRMKIAKDIAKETKADVVVCGATGLNAVERFLIGSVSESIVRYAPCDVLVVR